MTFLRKRSRSQCSTSSCDEDLAIIRKETKDVRKYSRMSSNTQVTARDYDINDSCVFRNFPKHKSAHLRFLAWVQYTRQFPDHSITDDERRTCPLLWCRTIFHDQDAMLKHVWNCEHLSKGLYWCFQCQKPERVGKFQCRRCQGGSSKTDRIATVARKMFSALGARRGMERSPAAPITDRHMALWNISEGSEARGRWNSQQYPGTDGDHDDGRPPYWDPPAELPNTCLSEMENTYVVPEMSGGWDQFSQELPASQDSRSTSREFPIDFHTASSKPQNLPQSVEPCNVIPCCPPSSFGSPVSTSSPRPTRSILPRLNTNTQFDEQRELHQRESRFRHPDNPMSATVVSPLSATGGFDFGTLDALDVSPTDSEASGKSLFTDSGYSSATFESSWNGSDLDFDFTTGSQDLREKSNKQSAKATKKFIGWHAAFIDPPVLPKVPAVTQVNTMTSFTDFRAEHSARRCNVQDKPKSLSPHWTDAQSLVNSFSEVLDEHLQHSRAALKQMASNTITRELLSLSSSSIVSIGLSVLAGLLERRKPNAIVQLFAFTHIAYALAIAVDHDSSKVQTSEWFQDSLSLLENLASERQRQTYTQIVRVIWQPRVSSALADSLSFPDPANQSMQSENRLIRACKHFLDIQESFIHRRNPVGPQASLSQFDFVQASFANKVKNHGVIEKLMIQSSIEAFIEDVVEVEKRLNTGLITDLRQLELELVCAGKLASQSDIAYTRFLDHVTEMCDSLRAEDKSCKSRTSHHLDSVSEIQRLLPDEEDVDEEAGGDEAEFDIDLDLDLNLPDSGYSTMDFTSGSGEIQDLIDMFAQEADEISNQPRTFGNPFSVLPQQPTMSTPNGHKLSKQSRGVSSNSLPVTAAPTPELNPYKVKSSPPTLFTPSQTDKYRCHCGYEPTGSEEWKASNFARHKRTQHAPAAKSYKCSFPGCKAKYRRSDNLRAHLRLKGHGDEDLLLGDFGEGSLGVGADESELSARPLKRRRKGGDGEMVLR